MYRYEWMVLCCFLAFVFLSLTITSLLTFSLRKRLLQTDYDTGISPQPLVKASELPNGDCRSLPKATSDDDYEQCAHFYPEFWGNPLKFILQQKIEPPQGIGFLGVETWFVTKFTADEYPQFVSNNCLYIGFCSP